MLYKNIPFTRVAASQMSNCLLVCRRGEERTPSTRNATTCRCCLRPTRIACLAQASMPSSRRRTPLKPTTPPSRMPSSPYRAAITLTQKSRSASTEDRQRNALVNPSASHRYNTGSCATWRRVAPLVADGRSDAQGPNLFTSLKRDRGVHASDCVHVHASVCAHVYATPICLRDSVIQVNPLRRIHFTNICTDRHVCSHA